MTGKKIMLYVLLFAAVFAAVWYWKSRSAKQAGHSARNPITDPAGGNAASIAAAAGAGLDSVLKAFK